MTQTTTLINALANVAKVNMQLSTRNLEVLRTARQLGDELTAQRAEAAALQAERDALQAKLHKATTDLTLSRNDLANLQQQYITLQADLDAANTKLAKVPAPVAGTPVAVRRDLVALLQERAKLSDGLPAYDGKYRLLNNDDTTQIGDEHYNEYTKRWELYTTPGISMLDPSLYPGSLFRRRILPPSDVEGLPDGCILGPDHELVQHGESLSDGMERWSILKGWHQTVIAPGAVWLSGAPYRKPKRQYAPLPEGVEIGEGYCQLYKGQVIQDGDELLSDKHQWLSVHGQSNGEPLYCIGSMVYRRKI